MGARQHRAVTRAMDERRTRITAAGRGLPRPDDLLALARQRFDAASGRLGQSLKAATAASRSRFDRVAGRLTVKPLLQQISRDRETVIRLSRDARRSLDARMEQRRQSLSAADKLLRAFSYQAVLERGFALVRDGDGQPVRTVAATSAGMGVSIEFADGQADAVIGVKGTKKSGSSVKSSGGGKPGGGQGSLF
ncbi:MAG: exodeoxyribonuclease VII large subunit, partial [Anderseniella sp.]